MGNKIFGMYRRIFVLSQYSALIHVGKYSLLIRELINEYKCRIRGISNSDKNWINIVWDKLEKELNSLSYSTNYNLKLLKRELNLEINFGI